MERQMYVERRRSVFNFGTPTFPVAHSTISVVMFLFGLPIKSPVGRAPHTSLIRAMNVGRTFAQ
jgi:hypothetical protein